MKYKVILVLFSMFFISIMSISSVMASDGEWVSTGGPNYIPEIVAITAGISNTNYIIYACATTSSGTIMKSTDYGVTWEFSLASGEYYNNVCTHPQNAAVAYVLNSGSGDQYDGIWVTLNQGNSWYCKDDLNGLENFYLKSIYVLKDDLTGSTAYVGCNSDTDNPDAVYFTDDYGETWSALNRSGLPDEIIVNDLVVDEDNNNYIYLVNSIVVSIDGLVYRSTDGGSSWETIADESDFPEAPIWRVGSIAMDPTDENVLSVLVTDNYAVSYLYYTTNAQETDPEDVIWNLVPYSSTQNYILGNGTDLICDSQGVVYAATFGGFLVSWDRYSSPQYLNQLPDPTSNPIGDPCALSIMVNPINDSELYVGTSSLFYFSNDGGDSFEERVGNLYTYDCKSVVASMPYIFSGNTTDESYFGSITVSSNYGQTWINSYLVSAPECELSYCTDLDLDYESNTILSAQTYSPPGRSGFTAMLKSVDMGSNWTLSSVPDTPNSGSDYVSCIAFDNYSSTQQEILFAGFATKLNNSSSGVERVGLSNDNGESWSSNFIVDAGDVSIKDIATGYEPYWADFVIVADSFNLAYVSDNLGSSWSNIGDSELPSLGYSVAVSNVAQDATYCPVYIGTNEGVWRNSLALLGINLWEDMSYGLDSQFLDVPKIILNPAENEILYCTARNSSDEYKIYVSADSARSWIDLSSGLPDGITVNDFSIDPTYPDTIYAATSSGIFKLNNPVKSGTISEDQTWGPGTVIINGDVTIDEDVEVTIAGPCSLLVVYDFDKISSGVYSSSTEIIVYGTLNAAGLSDSRIVFSSSNGDDSEPGDWYGIRFKAGSQGNLDYCDIKDARYGIYAYSNATVELNDCCIEDCYTIGILSTRGILSAERCTFDDAGGCGVYSTYSQTEIDSCEFTGCDTYGIYCYGTPNDSLDSSVISYCTISDDSNYGIRVSYNDDMLIKGNNITSSTACLYLYNSDAKVIHDTLQSIGTYGIYMSATDADVDSCLIQTSSYQYKLENGIYVTGSSSPTIDACRFEYVVTGVYINGSATPYLGYCGAAINTGYNDLEVCVDYYIYQNSTTEPEINAENNYYGSTVYSSKFYGNIDYKPVLTVDPFLKQNIADELPSSYSLSYNYPNPFNPTTNISYSLAEAGHTTIEIFNVLGQNINTLVDEYKSAGEYTVVWDGTNSAGQQVSSGVYFYKITSGYFTETKKMAFLR